MHQTPYSIQYIGVALKVARKQKKLSQRALSSKTGIPQSHLSKIEQGVVDLQISSLIEIVRVLELELMLVPRQLVPAFQTLIRKSETNTTVQIPVYRLDEEETDDN